MGGLFFVKDPDPNNFVVSPASGERRYIFHVVPGEHGRALSLASWNRKGPPTDKADTLPPGAKAFAESEAKRLGLID